MWVVFVVVQMHDTMVAGALQAFLSGNRQGSSPWAAVDLRNRDGGRVCLEFIEIEREGEPAPIERLADHRTAAPIAVPGNRSLPSASKSKRMPNGDAADVELFHQASECR